MVFGPLSLGPVEGKYYIFQYVNIVLPHVHVWRPVKDTEVCACG